MGVLYRLFYRLGFHPWEDLAEHPPFANKLAELFEREESGREPPYGPALDLGCGSGVWGVKLAERGWQVTGVDLVDKAWTARASACGRPALTCGSYRAT
jgi:methylase of polypeptide subunit release factors